MNLLVISNKRYHQDFRKYLVQAAEGLGYRAAHVRCHDGFILSYAMDERAEFPLAQGFEDVVRALESRLGPGRLVILTGMNGTRNHMAVRLAAAFPDAVALYDVYDDFGYGTAGDEAAEKAEHDLFWRQHTDGVVVLNRRLADRYADALHLDNASHLSRLDPSVQGHAAVYAGSLDRRTDFSFLRLVSSLGIPVNIHGEIHDSYPEARDGLVAAIEARQDIHYRGGFTNDDLPTILQRYSIGLLPYHPDHPWTRYVNPDKLYHYLNAGLEVVAAAIPQAVQMAPFVHLVREGDMAEALRASLAAGSRTARWPRHLFMWERRWQRLCAYAAGLTISRPREGR